MNTIKYTALSLLTCIGFLGACTKMDDYKRFVDDVQYTGKVDSTIVHAGYKRIKLSMILGNDPAIRKIKAFWNNNTVSKEIDVVRTAAVDTVDLYLNDMEEGVYNFEIYTYDAAGNSSVKTYATGRAIGDNYQGSLANRNLKTTRLSDDGTKVLLDWGTPSTDEIAIEITYTDQQNTQKKIIAPVSQLLTEVPDYKESTELTFRSMFLPDPLAIDTLFALPTKITLPKFERKLNKSLWRRVLLPTDANDGYGWVMPNMWDESYGEPGFHTPPGSKLPQWFTIDLGAQVKLSRFRTWQRVDGGFLFNQGNPKKWELWGSNNPDANGGWNNWVKLVDCESVKPSGLPLGQTSAADLALVKAGEEFRLPAAAASVRYLRFKILNTWSGSDFVHILELSCWTHDR